MSTLQTTFLKHPDAAGNQITFTSGGDVNFDNGAVYLDSTNNRLGIGTTTPTEKIHATGNAILQANNSYIGLENAAGTSTGYIQGQSSFLAIAGGSGSSNEIAFFPASTEALRIDSSARLLVGTSSDSQETTLKLQGSSAGSGDRPVLRLSIDGTPSGANSTLSAITAENSAGSAGASVVFKSDAAWSNGSSHPSRIEFSTTADGASSPTERMRIKANGETLFGVTSSPTVGGPYGTSIREAGNIGLFKTYRQVDGSNVVAGFGGTVGQAVVYGNGDVKNTNNSYGAISDIKLKENIVNASSQWDDIKTLRPVNYNLKEGQTHTQIGLIAQEVELVSPGLVSESPDLDEEGNDLGTTTKSVNYSVLYMKAVKALQEAMDRIETLEANNADLLARVSALEAN